MTVLYRKSFKLENEKFVLQTWFVVLLIRGALKSPFYGSIY